MLLYHTHYDARNDSQKPEMSDKNQIPVTNVPEHSPHIRGTFAAHSWNICRTFAAHSPPTKAQGRKKKEFKPFEIFT